MSHLWSSVVTSLDHRDKPEVCLSSVQVNVSINPTYTLKFNLRWEPQGIFFFAFFLEKNGEKLRFLSVFSLFLYLFLSFSVHTVCVPFSLINFTKVDCEG
jgi:hypothetical protein